MSELTWIRNSVHLSNDSLQRPRVPLNMVRSNKVECSEQGDMAELTPILKSVHTSKDNLHKRHVPLSVVTIIENDCSEQGEMTEMTPIVKSVHTSNDSFLEETRATQRGHQHRVPIANMVA
jgi:hypothetical protein